MFTKYSVILLTCMFIQFSSEKNVDDLVVELLKPNGKIRGHVLESAKGREYYAFQQIPYGKPPVGENRFRPPELHDDWDGILDCTENTKICYQFNWDYNSKIAEKSLLNLKKINGTEESEDCLYINVYTPVKPGSKSSLSVFLFIHGGAFVTGDGTLSTYGPKYLIDEDIVIVTMNYRLGPLGFLSTGDSEISGNMGLKDQHLALQWTYKNIHLFGGNPQDIVLGGESAGSTSVGYHLLSPRTKGLISGFIQQSGSHIADVAIILEPRKFAYDLGRAMDPTILSENTSSLVYALKKASPEDLVEASALIINPDPSGFISSKTWTPVIEDVDSSQAFLTSPTYIEMMKGDFNRVPSFIGFNSEESLWFFPSNESVLLSVAARYDVDSSMLINPSINVENRTMVGEKLKEIYTASSFEEDIEAFIRFTSDVTFTRATIRQAEITSEHVPVYLYQLSAAVNINDKYSGVAHALDLLYLWEMNRFPREKYPVDEEVRAIVLRLWWNFIKYKNPTPVKDPVLHNIEWPTVEESILSICFNFQKSPKIKKNICKRNCNEMSFRGRVLGFVEVVLRVPPLFVIDEILKIGILGITELSEDDLSNIGGKYIKFENVQSNVTTNSEPYDPLVYKLIVMSVIRLLISTLGCAVALCMFILSTKHLVVVYMYLMSVALIFTSYWTNVNTLKTLSTIGSPGNETINLMHLLTLDLDELTKHKTFLFSIAQNYLLQALLSIVFTNTHLGPRSPALQKILPLAFLVPSLAAALPLPPVLLDYAPLVAVIVPLGLVKFVLCTSALQILHSVHSGYVQAKNFVSNFGMSALVESEWLRLNVPEVLRTFWMLRVLEHTGIFFLSGFWDIQDEHTPYFRLLKYLMVTGCDTLTAVLGITSIVSFICNYIGRLFQWILLTDDENDKNFGTVSAIVFYILALQTGLTSLEPDVRFVRLCRNFCLLFTALLHFTHNVVNPLLMSLSASHNPSLRRHLHALLVCGVLVVLPVMLMYFLWGTQETSTWLLAVTAFSVEVIVKVFVSLAIYSLFLLDARRETFWEKLDDYIYYIRAFGNTIEFCFGIFLFFNGAWILVFESGSAIRAVMMCIHAYFNIWCDAKAGWSVFMKRRTAVKKIDSLPEADKEQLRQLDDVCAICYQEMGSAKITRCRHFFHGVCLRKWLYVQDRCPLCHEIMHAIDAEERRDVSERVDNEEGDYDR